MSSKPPAVKRSWSSVAQNNAPAAAPVAAASPAPATVAAAVAPISGAQQISQYLQSLSNREQNGHRKAIHTLLGNLAGKQVTVEFNDGNIVKGVWHTSGAFYEKAPSNDIVLKAAELIQSGSTPKDFAPGNTLIFDYSSVVSVTATIVENARATALREFKTDSATSKRKDISHLEGRDLVGLGMDWLTPTTNMALESSVGDNREWNQFAANEQLFGVKSSYDENIYTKPLDKGTISADRLARAEKLAALIEGADSDNIHLREERGQANERDLSEEALYSGVIRDDYQGANNTKEKWEGGATWKRPAPKPVTNAWERKPKILAQSDSNSSNSAPSVQAVAPVPAGGRGAGRGGRGEGRGEGRGGEGRGEGRGDRESNTRERRAAATAATSAPSTEGSQNKSQLGIDTTVAATGASNVASPPPGLLPTPPKPAKVGEQSKHAQNVASDANTHIIPQMPELIPTDSLAESAAHAMQVANSVLDMVTETTTHLSISEQEKEKEDKKEQEKEANAAKSSLNPNASSFTFNPNAKEFSFVPSSFTPAAVPVPAAAVSMSMPISYMPVPSPVVMPGGYVQVTSPAVYAQQPPAVPVMVMDNQLQNPYQQQAIQPPAQQQQAVAGGLSQGQSPAQQQQQPQPMMGQSPGTVGMMPPPPQQQQAQQQVMPQQPQQQMMYDPTTGVTMPVPMNMGGYMYPQQANGAVGYTPAAAAAYIQQQYAAYGYAPSAVGGYTMPAGVYYPSAGFDSMQLQQYQAQFQAQQAQAAALYGQQYNAYANQMVGPPGQVSYDPYGQQQQQQQQIGGYYSNEVGKPMGGGGRGNNMGSRGGGGRGNMNSGGRYNNNIGNNRSPRTNSYSGNGGGYNNNYNNNRYNSNNNNGGGYNSNNNNGNSSAGQRTPGTGGNNGTPTQDNEGVQGQGKDMSAATAALTAGGDSNESFAPASATTGGNDVQSQPAAATAEATAAPPSESS